MTPHTSTLVLFGIPALALLVVALVGLGVLHLAGPRRALWFTLGSVLWLAFAAALGLTGFLTHFEGIPPRLLLLMGPMIALPIWLGCSRVGSALSAAPVALLVGFQGFRLPLELIMHQAAREGTMPAQMTYTGSNVDIVTGVSAIIVATLAACGLAPRWLLLTWNTLGSLLLVAILVIAVASLPTFAAFGSEPAQLNTWVAHFPFVWLPAGLVSAAILGHVLLWRRLWSKRAESARGDR
ncbi:MAG TPA: hypothetical protein VJV79_19260 [Polyangiaceae bacterium]|nr:hypothetical protein [Polyangiaceae bacterium]